MNIDNRRDNIIDNNGIAPHADFHNLCLFSDAPRVKKYLKF